MQIEDYNKFLEYTNLNKVCDEIRNLKEWISLKFYKPEIYKIYVLNREKLIKSYFEHFTKDLINCNINIGIYYNIFILENSFEEKESLFFAEKIIEMIDCLNKHLIKNTETEEILNFIWNFLDRIFHESYHLETGFEDLYKIKFKTLRLKIIEIDPYDKALVKQKIEQFIEIY